MMISGRLAVTFTVAVAILFHYWHSLVEHGSIDNCHPPAASMLRFLSTVPVVMIVARPA
jgi:hypothetical protein